MQLYLRLLFGLLRQALRSRNDLLIENLVLRQQLAVYARRSTRPRLRDEDRVFWSVVSRTWRPWRTHLRLVQPETVVRWHRTAWRRYWTWKSRGPGPGRPRIDRDLRMLILRLATENPRWGSVRIVGELRALGFSVSARTSSCAAATRRCAGCTTITSSRGLSAGCRGLWPGGGSASGDRKGAGAWHVSP